MKREVAWCHFSIVMVGVTPSLPETATWVCNIIANGAHGCVTLFFNSIHQKMFKNLYAWSPSLASGDREMNNTESLTPRTSESSGRVKRT